MEKVFYSQLNGKSHSEIAKVLIEKVVDDKGITLNAEVPIKVHFGEAGNTTFIPAKTYDGVIDYLKGKGVAPSFIETNVLYRGRRTTKTSHIRLAKEHGFEQLPIIIADGERGEAYDEVEINQQFFKTCKIGREFSKYGQFVVASHFKGHGQAGFGGAIKQLAMGFAARGGKMAQHSAMVPKVTEEKCINCKACVRKCDVEAIVINERKAAEISEDKCVGCAGCIAVCPTGAIRNDWDGKDFKKKMTEYALAASQGKEIIYISFLMNITKDCDCIGQHMDKIADDIGILASTDPVAIDQACMDLLKDHGHTHLFDEGLIALSYGEEIGLGNRKYKLIAIDN